MLDNLWFSVHHVGRHSISYHSHGEHGTSPLHSEMNSGGYVMEQNRMQGKHGTALYNFQLQCLIYKLHVYVSVVDLSDIQEVVITSSDRESPPSPHYNLATLLCK